MKYYKASGFTLAEVLITLGIIGVVAGMTIPVLMQSIQDRQFKEAAKEAFSKASQAVQMMKMDNGGSMSSYSSTASSFKPVFITYFKVLQDCSSPVCVPATQTSDVYQSLHGDQGYFLGYHGEFITTDGMFWGIYNNGTDIAIIVDVNGYTKGPNIFGRDTFMFYLLNDSLVPMGSSGTWNYIGTCDRNHSSKYEGLSCMHKVMQGIDY